MSIFEITGKSERRINYDIAIIKITFSASSKITYDSSEKTLNDCEVFLEEIEKLGIKPSSFSLDNDEVTEDIYRNDPDYESERCIKLEIPFDMVIINSIHELLNTNKYNAEFEMDHKLSNEKKIRTELINEAVLDSKEKAEMLAKTLGMKVKGIKSMATDNEYGNYSYMEHEECRRMAVAAGSSKKTNELKSKDTMIHERVEVKWILE